MKRLVWHVAYAVVFAIRLSPLVGTTSSAPREDGTYETHDWMPNLEQVDRHARIVANAAAESLGGK